MHFILFLHWNYCIALEFGMFDSSEDIEFHNYPCEILLLSSTTLYEKKGTFDFINPHFTNLYYKNSSNR
jgi:hypothetical protein